MGRKKGQGQFKSNSVEWDLLRHPIARAYDPSSRQDPRDKPDDDDLEKIFGPIGPLGHSVRCNGHPNGPTRVLTGEDLARSVISPLCVPI